MYINDLRIKFLIKSILGFRKEFYLITILLWYDAQLDTSLKIVVNIFVIFFLFSSSKSIY